VYLGGTVVAGTPADFRKFIADETEKWGKVAKFAGIKAIDTPFSQPAPILNCHLLKCASESAERSWPGFGLPGPAGPGPVRP
jgi:hypothetical protein